MEHQRRFDVARRECRGCCRKARIEAGGAKAEAAPLRGGRPACRAGPAASRPDDPHHIGIAAVGIDDDKLAQARRGARLRRSRTSLRMRLSAENVIVPGRSAGARSISRSSARPGTARAASSGSRASAVLIMPSGDRGVRHDREMRPMLLGRRHRQDRERGLGIERGETRSISASDQKRFAAIHAIARMFLRLPNAREFLPGFISPNWIGQALELGPAAHRTRFPSRHYRARRCADWRPPRPWHRAPP